MIRRSFFRTMAAAALVGFMDIEGMDGPPYADGSFDLRAAINRDWSARLREVEEKHYITGDGVTA